MENIGIIGAGHIGITLATLLKRHGVLDDAHLQISYKGRPATLDHLKQAGLEPSIASNAEIFSGSDIIFLTIKPRDYESFKAEESADTWKKKPLLISTVAGHPLSLLREELQYQHIVNVMPSGPETLLAGNGICALYPADEKTASLMVAMGIQVFPVGSEAAFYLFTTALCLPAAFLQLGHFPDKAEEIAFIARYHTLIPAFETVYQWAKKVTPFELDEANQSAVINNMSTPGGVTEQLAQEIKQGQSLPDAFAKALQYCEALATK